MIKSNKFEKLLGVKLDNKLSFEKHIHSLGTPKTKCISSIQPIHETISPRFTQ